MTEITDVEIIAYVDGYLDEAAQAAFEERMRDDPALTERIAAHCWMTWQIVSAFGPPPGDGIDPTLVARLGLVRENVTPFPVRAGASSRKPLLAFLASGAIAASLVAGVLIGQRLDRAPAPWLKSSPQEQVLADGTLAKSLSANLAGQPGALRIGMSFRTAHGLCRTFSGDGGLSGIGCKQGDNWVVPIVVSTKVATVGGDYRLAAGEVAPAVMAEVDRRIVGDPLAPGEEEALRKRGWKD